MASKDSGGSKTGATGTGGSPQKAIQEGYTIIRKGGYTPAAQPAQPTDSLPQAPAGGTGEATPTQSSAGTSERSGS
ncbi:MAG: hypothetical protein L0177_15695 [Chloroflexi bacterium]|nr:hypothetical protein [Chloroflexota bacterium]